MVFSPAATSLPLGIWFVCCCQLDGILTLWTVLHLLSSIFFLESSYLLNIKSISTNLPSNSPSGVVSGFGAPALLCASPNSSSRNTYIATPLFTLPLLSFLFMLRSIVVHSSIWFSKSPRVHGSCTRWHVMFYSSLSFFLCTPLPFGILNVFFYSQSWCIFLGNVGWVPFSFEGGSNQVFGRPRRSIIVCDVTIMATVYLAACACHR